MRHMISTRLPGTSRRPDLPQCCDSARTEGISPRAGTRSARQRSRRARCGFVQADRQVVEVDDEFHEAGEQALVERQYVGEHADRTIERHGRQPRHEPDASGAELLGRSGRSAGRLLLADPPDAATGRRRPRRTRPHPSGARRPGRLGQPALDVQDRPGELPGQASDLYQAQRTRSLLQLGVSPNKCAR